jgi:hypothetical protein
VHLVVGSAGHKLSDVEHGQEEWCAAKWRRFGYARLTINSETSMAVEFVAADDGEGGEGGGGEVLDRHEVVASAARRAMCPSRRNGGGSGGGVAAAA